MAGSSVNKKRQKKNAKVKANAQANLNANEAFKKLFLILRDADLFADGPKSDNELQDVPAVEAAIDKGAKEIPALYHETYIWPFRRNLGWVMPKVSAATLETLAGAVCDHVHQDGTVTSSLKGFLAVSSNLYRSFLSPEPTARAIFPTPNSIIPPLATFRPKLNLDKQEFAPFTLPIDETERLCGAKVAVVSMPSCYRNHPVLCWGAIAHETGGHDVIHAYPGLIEELQQGIRRLFYPGPDPKGQNPESRDQFLGLLWQYWTEEAASDVYAVMNLGPNYGKQLAVYIAALNERIIREKTGQKANEPLLTVSWPPNDDIWWVDSHPTDILKLNVIIGAIECLPLSDDNIKNNYIDEIKACIKYALDVNEGDYDHVKITGKLYYKPGKYIKVEEDERFQIERSVMEEHARRVGRFIATQSLISFNGNCIQDLETWDDSDEAITKEIEKKLTNDNLFTLKEYLGDTAQLLAGAVGALYNNPDKEYYKNLNYWVQAALVVSFFYDPIWGTPTWHPLAGGPPRLHPERLKQYDEYMIEELASHESRVKGKA